MPCDLKRHLSISRLWGAYSNCLRMCGLLHVEPNPELRKMLRFPRLSLCAGLILLGLATSISSVHVSIRRALFWSSLLALFWAGSEFLLRRIYMRSQLSSSNVRYTKSEVEDFAKFSGLLVAAGGIPLFIRRFTAC